MEHKIFVSVQGSVAEVCEETVSAGIVVEILDFDNFAATPERELSLWSPEIREYWAKNHAQWGRCGKDCPSRVQGITS
jgi:hypothetical protein